MDTLSQLSLPVWIVLNYIINIGDAVVLLFLPFIMAKKKRSLYIFCSCIFGLALISSLYMAFSTWAGNLIFYFLAIFFAILLCKDNILKALIWYSIGVCVQFVVDISFTLGIYPLINPDFDISIFLSKHSVIYIIIGFISRIIMITIILLISKNQIIKYAAIQDFILFAVYILLTATACIFLIKENLAEKIITSTTIIMSLLMCLIEVIGFAQLLLLSKNAYQLAKEQNQVTVEHLKEEQYNALGQSFSNLQGWKHDIKNHFISVYGLLEKNSVDEAQQYIKKILGTINSDSFTFHSQNIIFDSILGQKLSEAESHHIAIHVQASIPSKLVDDVDCCSIIGNLMDNAIHANKKNKQTRFINVTVEEQNSFCRIEITNPMPTSLDDNENDEMKGIGLNQVKKATQKYKGIFSSKQVDNMWRAVVMIPTPPDTEWSDTFVYSTTVKEKTV